MCIATIFDSSNKSTDPLAQDVVAIDIINNVITVSTILGEKMTWEANIKHVDFLKHTVIINTKIK